MRLVTIPCAIVLALAATGAVDPSPSTESETLDRISPVRAFPAMPVGATAEPSPTPTAEPTPSRAPTARPATPTPKRVASSSSSATRASVATARPKPVVTAAPTPHHHHPPAPEPEPDPEPTQAPERRSWSKQEVKAQIREAWPANDDEAIAVVDCETGGSFDPRMTSSNGLYKGLWQFHQDTWERWGGSGDPRDASPAEQTRIAWNGYEREGWSPWPSCAPSS